MTVSDSSGARHPGEPEPSPSPRLHSLIALAGTLLILGGIAGAAYLIWPAAAFWIGLGFGVASTIAADITRQVHDQRAQRRGG